MNNKLRCLLFLGFFYFLLICPARGSPTDFTIQINNQPIAADVSPQLDKGQFMIPLRAVAETMGGQVTWHGDYRAAVATLPGVTLAVVEGSTLARMTGDELPLEVPVSLKQGRIMVPVQLILEATGTRSNWDSTHRILSITREDSGDFTPELLTMQHNLQWELWRMDQDLAAAADELDQTDLVGEEARRILKDLAAKYPNLLDVGTTDAKGIIKALEPYNQAFEGSDISQQAHIKKMQATRLPVLSEGFAAVEGYQAIVLDWPIINQAGNMIGFVHLLIKPELFAALAETDGLIGEELVIMETDGHILFDSKKGQIGQDAFADYLNQSHARDLARKIADNRSGRLDYTDAEASLKQPLRQAAWTTVGLHGTEWRLIQLYSPTTDLSGKLFAVPSGTMADVLVLSRYPEAKFIYYDTALDCCLAVYAGQADAAAYDEPILRNIAAKHPGLVLLPDMITVDDYGFAVALDNRELKTAIDDVVRELEADGTYEHMISRWLPAQGEPAPMPVIELDGSNGILRFGTAPVTEPFSFLGNNQQVAGFDIELASYVAQKLGKQLEIVSMDFGDMIPAIISGQVDMIGACITISEERAKRVLFSDPYYQGGIAAVVKR